MAVRKSFLCENHIFHQFVIVCFCLSTRVLGWQLWTNSPSSDATIVLFLVSGFSLRFTGQKAQL